MARAQYIERHVHEGTFRGGIVRFYSNGRWSVGPVGAVVLTMLWLAAWPVWVVRGAYRIDVRLGHVAVGVVAVLLIAAAIAG